MGASNVKAVYAKWTHLDDLPFRVLTYMAVVSHDVASPRYWAGREPLALAAGRPVPDPVRGNADVAKARKAAFKAVDRVMDTLTAAGAIVQTGAAHSGRNGEYALNLVGTRALFDGRALVDPVDMTGRCGTAKADGSLCIAWPKRDTSRCVAHQESTPVSGPNGPRSVDPMHPAEWTQAPRSVDIKHPAHRGAKEQEEQEEQVRKTGEEQSLDLDTDLPVVRARPKCPHGFVIAYRGDGQATCTLCRRETPCPADANPATPPAAPHPTAGPTDASADPNASDAQTPHPSQPDLWPTPATPASSGQPDQPSASSSPAPDATPPSTPPKTTPAAGNWPIVHIRQSDGRPPEPAELREESPIRPTVVKVIYLASRTSAWVAKTRIIEPLEPAA